ncbi:GNAT family N-acetyltransferase [Thalassospira lucentensis]|uniref:GNAT family N-acetyltransferase n=1 Tax=Thalassospira lucentensis TaxID=168935 RepID=UPI003D2EC143
MPILIVIEFMKSKEKKMFIRSCDEHDSEDLFAWRNDPLTREMSLSTDLVSKAVHERWFANKCSDPNCSLYIGEKGGEKTGVVRFDYDPAKILAEVSINLNPQFRGKRISVPFLLVSIEAFHKVRDCPIYACVRDENVASCKLFSKAGFHETKVENGVREFILAR